MTRVTSDENGIQDKKNPNAQRHWLQSWLHFLRIFQTLEAIWSKSSESDLCVGSLYYMISKMIFSLNVNWSDTSPFQLFVFWGFKGSYYFVNVCPLLYDPGGNQKTENQCVVLVLCSCVKFEEMID
jgi:hypothetical protein